MNIVKIQTVLDSLGIKPNPARDMLKLIRRAVFRRLFSSWIELTELPEKVREQLVREVSVSSLALSQEVISADGKTIKAALSTVDGKVIESVLMIHPDGRRTVCVSSQVGCPMGCAFCATGQLGFTRNLSVEEIIDQVLHCARRLVRDESGGRITNVVVMGMGEPLHNLDAVLDAFRELNHPHAFGLSARQFTVSTCGLVPGIRRLAAEPLKVNLAVSLHASNQAVRERLMPVAKIYPLDQLMAACRDYVEQTGRKIFFEYLLIDGVNDSAEQAEELARLMDHPLYHVNLIKYHLTGAFQTSPIERREQFQRLLWEKYRVPVTMRVSFGEDIDAACGQLAGRGK